MLAVNFPCSIPLLFHGNPVCYFPQLNIMSFISELLEWFEVKKPDFVKPIQPINLTGLWLPKCYWEHFSNIVILTVDYLINKYHTDDQPLKLPCLLFMSFRCLKVTGLYKSCQREQQQVTESRQYHPDENGQGRRMKHEPQSTWNLPLNNWNLTYHSIYTAKTWLKPKQI